MFHFLPANITSIICYGVPWNEDEQRAVCTTTYLWYHQELQKVNFFSIEGFTLPPPGVPYTIHHTRKRMTQVCKKPSIQGENSSTNAKRNEQPLNIQQRHTEMQEDIS